MLLKENMHGIQHLGLPVTDIDHASDWYSRVLGFQKVYGTTLTSNTGETRVAFLQLHDATLELYQPFGVELDELKTRSHGHIDHFAIDVLNVDRALEEVMARGARLDGSTPNGPQLLATFWSRGVRYANLSGPDGARVELVERLDADRSRRRANIGGWAHIGIPVRDIETSRRFYGEFGFSEAMRAEIPTPDGAVRASIMERNGAWFEFYQPIGAELDEVAARKHGPIDHMALDVTNIDSAWQELTGAGLRVIENQPVFLPFWEHGVRYFTILGPDNEKVEFNERLRR